MCSSHYYYYCYYYYYKLGGSLHSPLAVFVNHMHWWRKMVCVVGGHYTLNMVLEGGGHVPLVPPSVSAIYDMGTAGGSLCSPPVVRICCIFHP